MLAKERFNEIIHIVEERQTVTVQELTELLHSSESTIRRDLTELHKRGKIVKVHGGATALDTEYKTKDSPILERQNLNIEEKMRIAKEAAERIQSQDFVYIDAGTSTSFLVDCIKEKNAVYVTNAFTHAKKLVQKGCKAFLLGGELKETTEAIIGVEAVETLNKYNFTKGFFGTNGVHRKSGFTTPDVREASVKRKAFYQCKERYVLADSSKLGKISSVTFGDFEDAVIVTSSIGNSEFYGCGNIVEVDKNDIYSNI